VKDHPRRNAAMSTLFAVGGALLFLLAGCLAEPEGNHTPAPSQGPTQNSGQEEVDVSGGDAETTGEIDNLNVPESTDVQACLTGCRDECAADYNSCLSLVPAGSDQSGEKRELCGLDRDACHQRCESTSWDKGGCAAGSRSGPTGDAKVAIPAGAKRIAVNLRHCTHKVDLLVVSYGVLGFANQQGLYISAGGGGWFSRGRKFSGLASAAAGYSDAAPTDLVKQARVKIGGTEHVWPYPGAVGFSLADKIPNIDVSKPIIFVRTKVTVPRKSSWFWTSSGAAYWTHFSDYHGAGYSLDLVEFNRPSTRLGCEFSTDFDLYYFEKGAAGQ
jgi:hypothetical protein